MRLLSPENLESLTIDRLPSGRVVKIDKSIRVGDLVIFVGKNGNLYHTGRAGNYAYMPGNWPWTINMLKALLKLGAITQDHYDQHSAWEENYRSKRHNKYLISELVDSAKGLGIKLTQGQLNKINKLPR